MSTNNISFSIKKGKSPLIIPNLQLCFFPGTQERVRNSRVNEPSVLEPLKFYCICKILRRGCRIVNIVVVVIIIIIIVNSHQLIMRPGSLIRAKCPQFLSTSHGCCLSSDNFSPK